WDVEGTDIIERDLSGLFQGDVEVSYIVTELDEKDEPVLKDDEVVSGSSIPVGLTPVFVTP
ncbi:MAG: hypothetical protein HN348_36470, partial [Proteobacteria bacterium]|nr:hypothetical protein [Pseudomonadota bacterium]